MWTEQDKQDYSGPNRTNIDQVGPSGQIGPNRTKVDRIEPKWAEWTNVDRIGSMWTK